MTAPLYVVHCIDTEGPLHEPLEATFDRLEKIIGVKLAPTRESIEKLRRKEIDLKGKEDTAALIVSEQLLNYNDTWDKVDAMLSELLSPEYRAKYADSHGTGWIYSWFLLDHVGYDVNPRRRDIGYHNIFDHYISILRETNSEQDDIQFHFHPMSTYREAHVCATSYLRSPHLFEILSRRIIDRCWFPSCFRPGFHAERPDAHWFLEQWIPFDYANQATDDDVQAQLDVAAGRLGDWRRAPRDWSHYNPSHDDYQVPGNCNRTIFRCLNVGTRFKLLDEREVRAAFTRAAKGLPTVLSFTNHDFRDMRNDVASTHALITKVAQDYPSVEWQHARACDAARAVLNRDTSSSFRLTASMTSDDRTARLEIKASHDTFGPQPFLAIKTRDRRYLHDNLDIQVPRRHWTYTFDADTVPLDAVAQIGIASNDPNGVTHVLNLSPSSTVLREETWR